MQLHKLGSKQVGILKFQKVPEVSSRFQKVPIGFRVFRRPQKVPEGFKRFQKISEGSRRLNKVQECMQIQELAFSYISPKSLT